MSKIVDGLLYSESHEWVKVDGNVAIVGVSDYAQSELGDITYVDMPDVDDEVSAGDDFGDSQDRDERQLRAGRPSQRIRIHQARRLRFF